MKHVTTALFIFATSSVALFAQTAVSTIVSDPSTKFTDDLIFDNVGNLYCADYSGDAVYKRAPNGTITPFITGLNTPNGLAFNSAGDLYVCDNIGSRIYIVNSAGTPLDTIQTSQPSGIIKDIASDTMIFTTYGSQSTLKKLAPNGTISPFYSGSPLNGPVGLTYCGNELYMANFGDRKIFRVESDTLIFIAQLPGSGSLGFIECIGGKILATAYNGQKIYSVDPTTQTVNIYAGSTAGITDGTLDVAKFTTPNGIVANATGDTIYVSEYNTGHLRIITGFTLATPSLPVLTEIAMWPTPATDQFTLSVNPAALPYTMELFNTNGEKLKKIEVSTEKTLVDISALPKGVFLAHVQSDQGTTVLRGVKVD